MNFSQRIPFETLMEPVCAQLLREPNARLSRPPRDVRYGSNGSLSVNFETGQFYDHEAKIGGGVLAFIQHRLSCGNDGALAWLHDKGLLQPGRVVTPSEKDDDRPRSIVCAYDYLDENGTLLHQTIRYEPKTFRQRRPDPDNNRKWIWNLKGVRTVLFLLPEVLQAVKDGKPVYVVEGERDAHALRALGLTATCNPMGAGKWRDEYSDFLRDGDVVLVEDNDDPGRKHVEHLARSLSGVAKRVRALDISKFWPECPEHGDISNWLKESRGTVEKLNEIVDALPDWQPMSENTDEPTNTDDTSPSWECPDLSLLDDRRGELPPFPLDVLSPSWQDWARNAARCRHRRRSCCCAASWHCFEPNWNSATCTGFQIVVRTLHHVDGHCRLQRHRQNARSRRRAACIGEGRK
jgi:5S rRNA maturation endonuclease (ribonuclease M5)